MAKKLFGKQMARRSKKKITLEKSHIRKRYSQELVVLSGKNIKFYVRPEWHRDFRESHVDKIRCSLLKGNHFSEPITVNEAGGVRRLLNGNHRVDAVRRVLESYPDFSIEITVKKYKNLDREQEMEEYSIINNVRSENTFDRIKAHCIDSVAVQCMLKDKGFPVRVLFRGSQKAEVNALPITQVVSPFTNRNNRNFLANGSSIIKDIKAMDKDDVEKIADYLRFFKSVFGEITRQNMYANVVMLSSVGKIYFNSAGVELSKSQLKERLQRVMARHTAEINLICSTKSIESCRTMYEFLLRQMGTKAKPLFNVFA